MVFWTPYTTMTPLSHAFVLDLSFTDLATSTFVLAVFFGIGFLVRRVLVGVGIMICALVALTAVFFPSNLQESR